MSTSTSHDFPRISIARVGTTRATRYGKQLASHMAHKITTSWDEETATGTLEFNREGSTIGFVDYASNDGDILILKLATDDEHLDHLEEVIGSHLARFGAKEGLVVRWDRVGSGKKSGTTQGPVLDEGQERPGEEQPSS